MPLTLLRRARASASAALLALAATTLATGAVVAGDASPAAAHDRSFPTMLQQLRQCESGDNYGINTGNGYYGAYQFNLQTWRGVGGPGYPHQNPPHVQDEMATRLYEQRGWSPWPSCSRSRGLHATTVERPWAGRNPEGRVERASGERGGVAVGGFTFDRDSVPGAVEINAHVDYAREAVRLRADHHRPDVSRDHGVGEHHGVGAVVPASPGRHTVCLYALNQAGGKDTFLGCNEVVVPRSPIGAVERVEIVPGGVRVTGWTLDQDTGDRPTHADVHVNGRLMKSQLADWNRPDIAERYRVSAARGFNMVVPFGSEVCVYAIDTTGQSDNTRLECRRIF